MPYTATIIDTKTGEERDAPQGFSHEPFQDHYWWTEGNFGCDCNRELEFRRAGGEPTEPMGTSCGNDRYYVPYITLPDGERVNIDDPEPRQTSWCLEPDKKVGDKTFLCVLPPGHKGPHEA